MQFTNGIDMGPVTATMARGGKGLGGGNEYIIIQQDDESVMIAPEALAAILEWYEGEVDCCEGCKEPFTAKDIDGGRCISCGKSIT
jgi:hypothetical protein